MDPVDALRREINGLDPDQDPAPRKKPRPRGNRAGNRGSQATRPKRPQAGEEASILAGKWYQTGNRFGWEFPYDENFFALALEPVLAKDDICQRLRDAGRPKDVSRLVEKMIEVWWRDYVNGEVKPSNAKEYFLVIDWEDVRDYSLNSLRAKYLKQHGRPVPAPEYPNQQEFQARLRAQETNARLGRMLADAEDKPEVRPVTPEERARLRAFVEKRKSK